MMQAEKYILRRPNEAVLEAINIIMSSRRGTTIYVYPTLIARTLGLQHASVALLTLIMSILDELPFVRRVSNGLKRKRRYYAIDRRMYEEWVRGDGGRQA